MGYKDKFPGSFFEEEERCGYTVSGKLKKIWAVEIDLLDKFLRVCNKYDIKVCAYAGTLLGAVRHKGFIPWDDDMDVCLLREEFEKLLQVADKEFQYPYFFQTALSDRRYFCMYARLRNSETTGIITAQDSKEYNNGIYIDILVLDGYIEDEKLLKKQIRKRNFWLKFLNLYYSDLEPYHGYKKQIAKWVKKIENSFVDYKKLVANYEQVITQYNNRTERVTLMTHCEDFIRKYWCDKSDLDEIEYVEFETIQIPVPVCYDYMLRHMYGDYMKYPPVEERGQWHNDLLIFDPDTPYKFFKQ